MKTFKAVTLLLVLGASAAFVPQAPGKRTFLTRIHSSRNPGGKRSYAPTNAAWKTSSGASTNTRQTSPGGLAPAPKKASGATGRAPDELEQDFKYVSGTTGPPGCGIFAAAVLLALFIPLWLDSQGSLDSWKSYYEEAVIRAQSPRASYTKRSASKPTETVQAIKPAVEPVKEEKSVQEVKTPATTFESKEIVAESKTESSPIAEKPVSKRTMETVQTDKPIVAPVKEAESIDEYGTPTTTRESKKESPTTAEKAQTTVKESKLSAETVQADKPAVKPVTEVNSIDEYGTPAPALESAKVESVKTKKLDPNDIPWGEFSAEWVEGVTRKR